ncbi:hypothetical protein SynWH8103_00488 [Synechococcus sp. WH 8103]|nr:hypothetical protein SynWH8103_00488 [Synechococcus sp. WH 8103]
MIKSVWAGFKLCLRSVICRFWSSTAVIAKCAVGSVLPTTGA